MGFSLKKIGGLGIIPKAIDQKQAQIGKATQDQIAGLVGGQKELKKSFGDALTYIDPYQKAGIGALDQYQALLGLLGNPRQQTAISGLESTPGYQAELQAGQRAILQNAAATGGLRGGNVQTDLAEFGSGLFGDYYDKMLNRLGQFQSQGQSTAIGLGNLRMGQGAQLANIQQQIGEAQAQGRLAKMAAKSQAYGALFGGGGGVLGGMFGGPQGAQAGAQAGQSFGSLF